jgi:acyl-CoA synthetase (NDP forming)
MQDNAQAVDRPNSAATPRGNLSRLFAPRTIAVVGASAAPEKVGYQLVDALRDFPGEVYPINPKVAEVAGRRAYASLADAPRAADLVLVAVPATATPDVLRQAAQAGAGAAMIVSGGFAEAGASGVALQAELAAICRETGLRLLGPNTSGYASPGGKCFASFVPSVRTFEPGSLGIVAQSGGVNLTLAFLAQQRKLGVSLAVGLGNAVDVNAADVIEYLADDERTNVIVLHLEGVPNGRRLYEVIAATTPRKPVVVLPVGRAQVGEFAQSHTGNLMGAHAITVAAMRQAGAIVVESTEEAIACAAAFAAGRIEAKAEPGIAVLTGQAGPGLIILDALRSRGVNVPQLSDETVGRIEKLLPPMTYLRNPIDTGRPSPVFADVMIEVARDPAIDAILTFALDEPAALDPCDVFTRARTQVKQPILFATLGESASIDKARRTLAGLQTPTFFSPEQAATAAWALAEDAKARDRRARAGAAAVAATSVAGIARDEAAAKQLLREHGIRSPASVVCRTHEEAARAFESLGKPIVVKVLDANIAHKTEVGGVHLNVSTLERLHAALAAIDAIPGDRQGRGYLLEEMAPRGVDLIVGAKRDASFGATVLVGLGGTEAEALNDVSIRLAPLTRLDAHEMLNELRGSALLDGWRGAPAVDREAIVDALLAVGALMAAQPALKELDINPLRAGPHGVLALDALMIWDR